MVCSILSLDSQASHTKRPTPFIFTHPPTYLSTPISFLSQIVDRAITFTMQKACHLSRGNFLSKLHFTIFRIMREKMIVSNCAPIQKRSCALSKRFPFQLGPILSLPFFSLQWQKIIVKVVRIQWPLVLFFTPLSIERVWLQICMSNSRRRMEECSSSK